MRLDRPFSAAGTEYRQHKRQRYYSTYKICFCCHIVIELPDKFPEICPNMPELAHMFRVTEPKGLRCWLDAVSNRAVCGYKDGK